MAIGVFKKITERLMGKDSDQSSPRKGGNRKAGASGEGVRGVRSERAKGGRGGVPGVARPSRKSGESRAGEGRRGARRSGEERAEQGEGRVVASSQRSPVRGKSETRRARGRRRSEAVAQAAAELQEATQQQYPAKGVERQVARPSRKKRGERGRGGSERRQNTPSTRQRPGGAVGEAEQEARSVAHAAWSLDQFKVAEVEGKKRFHDFNLPMEIMHAVHDLEFEYCTPIQALSLEHALAGKNVAGRAQTGTGKTAAFLVAILTRYLRTPEERQTRGGAPRALVLAPTRELVIQICKDADELGKYCGLRSLAIYGGMDYDRQRREVSSEPVDLLVATPGRLLDFVRSKVVDLSKVDTLVIDEADRMLDMGFIPDVRSIIYRLPPKNKRATMLYSATLSEDVMRLASQWMESPVRAEVESEQVATKTVRQLVYVVTAREKFTVLYNHIQSNPDERMLVFCNRRTTTEDVARSLNRRGIRCEVLSGDVHQNRRLRVLEEFRSGKVRIVVATDVAGRGIHVDEIGYVVNFDFPYEPEDYVHRIGRTGRAGAKGVAISFADEDESFIIPDIEEYLGEELKCIVLSGDDELLKPLPPRPRQDEQGGRGRGRERVAREEAKPPQQQPVDESSKRAAVAPPQQAAQAAPKPEVAAKREPAKREPAKREPTRRESPPSRQRSESGQQRTVAPSQQRRQQQDRDSVGNRHSNMAVPAALRSALGPKPVYSEEWVPGE